VQRTGIFNSWRNRSDDFPETFKRLHKTYCSEV
jgi:hypothetical protein